ncbi:MAG: FMN-binding negative transcriptional regulator [Firmicutes bacterium]|nr:FMN-binding negative transcriptional regulator [Bacillota bacterium]
MYIPKRYQMNREEAIAFMKAHPFALLITVDGQRPVATHIPVEIREKDGKLYATGHIALGNGQKSSLNAGSDVLLIFQGPHAYISSSWYAEPQVPTWNYLAVHAYGSATILTEDELHRELDGLLTRYESNREQGRLWNTFDPALLHREAKGIVGFRVDITALDAAAKMSQNRNDTDYQRIVAELEKSEDGQDAQVARWMRAERQELFD